MKNFIALLFVVFLSTSAVIAQDQLHLVSGDTLEGKIDILMPDERYEEIIFETGKDKSRYKAYQFVSFLHDNKEYRTTKFGDKYRIMEVEKSGYLSLLKYRTEESYSYNAQFLQKTAGKGMEVPNFLFKKSMSNFLSDCGPISEAINKGNYRKRDVEILVDDYNNCMAQKTESRMSEQSLNKPAPASPLVDEFTNLSKQAKELNDSELANMLDDVVEKLSSGDPIPNYLKNALKDYVSDGHQLKESVDTLVGKL